jgi:hypothetical protein
LFDNSPRGASQRAAKCAKSDNVCAIETRISRLLEKKLFFLSSSSLSDENNRDSRAEDARGSFENKLFAAFKLNFSSRYQAESVAIKTIISRSDLISLQECSSHVSSLRAPKAREREGFFESLEQLFPRLVYVRRVDVSQPNQH